MAKASRPKVGEQAARALPQQARKDDHAARSSSKQTFLTVAGIVAIVAVVVVSVIIKQPSFLEHIDKLNATIQDKVVPRFEQFHREFFSRINESIAVSMAYLDKEEQRPGYQLAQKGAKVKHPIVMVPGFVTSGLEVWGGRECARKYFRQRLWAAIYQARTMMAERDCWKQHMMLDIKSGGDPPDIRVRAASGFEAADYFMANYWVWGKMIENLADVGYTPNEMAMEPYDWRLAFPMLEERDGYFTRLKNRIETMHKTTGEKAVLTSHSMGALVVLYFFAWVTADTKAGGGGGGKNWVDKHVHAYLNLAGVLLGVPKAASAILSGEMRDTSMMGPLGDLVENFFGRRLRRDLISSWGSLWAMLPKGGEAIWGVGEDMCSSRNATDPHCPLENLSPMLAMTDAQVGINTSLALHPKLQAAVQTVLDRQTHTTSELLDFFQLYGGGHGMDTSMSRLLSLYGSEKASPRTWHDPSRTPLPHAPKLKIYCMYGSGLDTERAYFYRRNTDASSQNETMEPPIVMDTNIQASETDVKFGVRMTNGDGSVPIVSLGYLCANAWQRKDSGLNPSGVNVITREYQHEAEFRVDDPMRSGPKSGEHVDFMGNEAMTEDFVRVVTGFEVHKVERRFVSDIQEIAAKINAHPQGGIFKRR